MLAATAERGVDEVHESISLHELNKANPSGLELIGLELSDTLDLIDASDRRRRRNSTGRDRPTLSQLGRESYADSISSESSHTSRSSWSSKTSTSTAASVASMGQTLVAMGLDAAEILAVHTTQDTARAQEKIQQVAHKQQSLRDAQNELKRQFLDSITDCDGPNLDAGPITDVVVPLDVAAIERVASQLEGLTKTAKSSFAALIRSFDASTQRRMSKLMRRFEYEWRKRTLGGSKRERKGNAKIPVRLGEFISKHIFMPGSRNLRENGSALFLVLFNLFCEQDYKSIKTMKRRGFDKCRRSILSDGHDLSGLLKLSDGVRPLRRGSKARRRKRHKRRAADSSTRPTFEVRTLDSDNVQHVNSENGKTLWARPKQSPDIEEYVDEDGSRVYKVGDDMTFRSLKPESNPYDRNAWDRIIEARSGRTLYLHKKTGEVVEKDVWEATQSSGMETKRSLTRRAVHKVSKYTKNFVSRIFNRSDSAGDGTSSSRSSPRISNIDIVTHQEDLQEVVVGV